MNKVNIIDVMNDANKTGWALAAFNIPSFDAMRAVMTASKDNGTPVIVQLSSKIVEHYGAKVLKSWFDTIQNHLKSVCFIHLDHCRDEKILRDCINSRWDMVMFDGSYLNIEDNIKFTEKYVKIAHKLNVAVEGEIGVIGGQEDNINGIVDYAKLDEVQLLCSKTKLDCVAVGFGNIHGNYVNKSKLRWSIFEGAYKKSMIPLVLHGGTGLTHGEFKRAIKAKAAKINISTDIKNIYFKDLNDCDLEKLKQNPYLFHETVYNNVYKLSSSYIKLFKKKEITVNDTCN